MSESAPRRAHTDRRQWLWDHIGRISGIVLGVLGASALVFLAAIGSKSALGLLVVLIAGLAMIIIGGRMRGL